MYNDNSITNLPLPFNFSMSRAGDVGKMKIRTVDIKFFQCDNVIPRPKRYTINLLSAMVSFLLSCGNQRTEVPPKCLGEKFPI